MMCAISVIFKILPKVCIHPIGENPPNPVTLVGSKGGPPNQNLAHWTNWKMNKKKLCNGLCYNF
jgi:hypothetical protein